MQKLLPNALFIGFTGTPLLKSDKQTSIATFGSYIHTYQFDQAVTDNVVLDLCYEARDISQYIGNKTKWGSCNINDRRIWLNLELAKKPLECLEYVLVHELAHLLERHHSTRFTALMDTALPNWRNLRDQLNAEYLAAENWL